MLGISLQAGACRQGIDKIGQLAKVVRANSDELIGAFNLIENQQSRRDASALPDERALDGGIEPQRDRPLQPRQQLRTVEPFRHDRDKPPPGRQTVQGRS